VQKNAIFEHEKNSDASHHFEYENSTSHYRYSHQRAPEFLVGECTRLAQQEIQNSLSFVHFGRFISEACSGRRLKNRGTRKAGGIQSASTGSRWCATARRRFSTSSVACAPRARLPFCHSRWSRVRADGRRSRRRLVFTNGSQTSNSTFSPVSSTRCLPPPSAQRAAEKFYLKQGLVQAAARASSCPGQVQVKNAPRGRAGCHRARGARRRKC